MGINPMNKITIIIRILFAVTLFQHKRKAKSSHGNGRRYDSGRISPRVT
jgi:hypothetical protein